MKRRKQEYDIRECERALAVNGWTQSELADQAEMSRQLVSKFFNSLPVANPTAHKIVTTLGLKMEDVLR